HGRLDFLAAYESQGREPGKEWIGVETNPASPFVDNVHAIRVVFTGPYTPHPVVSIAHANADGTHTDWSAPIALPEIGGTPQGSTYLFPHVTPDGAVYTTLVNETPAHGSFASTISLDQSNHRGLPSTSSSRTSTSRRTGR